MPPAAVKFPHARAPQQRLRWPGLVRNRAAAIIDDQRGHLFAWCPVFLGAGMGGYFALPAEPGSGGWAGVALGIAVLGILAWNFGTRAPVLIAALLVLAGLLLAGLRTHAVAAPVLAFRYYGPIEGRIVGIDRSVSDKVRLTLDRVVLADVPPARTPYRVRVSLHGEQGYVIPRPGLTVILTGHLAPPQGAVEPGGFDFQRHAWFLRLGAVGYTRTPVLTRAPPAPGEWRLWVHKLRMGLAAHVRDILPGRNGAFAAAITTGDRSGMDLATIEDLRISNLAHLLAISGLHMGMLTGFVFAAARYGLALIPRAALCLPIHKIAAGVAILAGAVYLALSGGNVATERAFVMVAVMLAAVMIDQRALTLRAVALAALIVLVRRPEAVLGPGFQMSFAATAALIAVFAALRDRSAARRWPRAAGWIAALVLSSAVAGLATAPFAAAHFNRVPHFGLIANVASVPVMGALVMPAAVLAAVLAPLGLSALGLKLMAPGIDWILGVAGWVAGLEGAVSHVPSPPAAVLPMLALGGLWIILWQGRARVAGAVPVAAALVLWAAVERPVLLISESGGLTGWMTAEGRALSNPRGEGFAARTWLENDGDPASQEQAHARGLRAADVSGLNWRHETGREAAARAEAGCAGAAIVVTSAGIDRPPRGRCTLFDRTRLRRTGPVAFYAAGSETRIVFGRDKAGSRAWNRAGRRRP